MEQNNRKCEITTETLNQGKKRKSTEPSIIGFSSETVQIQTIYHVLTLAMKTGSDLSFHLRGLKILTGVTSERHIITTSFG